MKRFRKILLLLIVYYILPTNNLFSHLFYLKPSLNLPILSEKIDLHAKNNDSKDIKLLGGLGYSANIGIKIKNSIIAEIGLGREFFSADISGSTSYGEFSYSFIDYTLMFNLSSNDFILGVLNLPGLGCGYLSWGCCFLPVNEGYIYFGVRQYMGTRLVRDLWPYSIHNYHYENSLGYYLGINSRFNIHSKDESIGIFIFWDLRYVFAKHKYKSKDIYYRGDYGQVIKFYNDWDEINGNSFVINVGFGFVF